MGSRSLRKVTFLASLLGACPPAIAQNSDACLRPDLPMREYQEDARDYQRSVEDYYGAATAYIGCLDAFIADTHDRYERDIAEMVRQYHEQRDAEIAAYQVEREAVMEELRRAVDDQVRAAAP